MTTYYVDPAATGANNGTSWTNAWTTLQTAADTATAGDVVYCRGTENLSAAIDFDTNSGTYDGGYIKFIGCNASGSNDGTRFTLKRASGTINGIYGYAVDFLWFENFSIEDFTVGIAPIISTSYPCRYWRLVNTRIYNSTSYGAYPGRYCTYWVWHRCHILSNGSNGVQSASGATFDKCEFIGNSGDGVTQYSLGATACLYCGCIFHGNGGNGVTTNNLGAMFVNCVLDGNTGHGIEIASGSAYVIGCRITNHASSNGIVVKSNLRIVVDTCYFQNNSTHITADRYDILPIDGGTAHVVLGGTDTDGTNGELLGGYKDIGSDDFNLKDTATLRSQAIELD